MKTGTNATLGGGGFHHFAIKVKNFEDCVAFYTAVLGFKEKIRWGEGNGRGILLDPGDGNYLEVFAGGSGEKPVGPMIHFALRTNNCDAVLQRARKAGAKVTMEPTDVNIPSTPGPTPVRIAFCEGPGGEVIEFFQNETT